MTDGIDENPLSSWSDSAQHEVGPLTLNHDVRAGGAPDGGNSIGVSGVARGSDEAHGNCGANQDFFLGGRGDDRLEGDGTNLIYMGGGGGDLILATGRHAISRGGSGNDDILGTLGNDWLTGDAGHDFIDASGGNDFIAGGAGDDQLYGRGGEDWIIGGAGDDRMSGGDDGDTFAFRAGNGDDTIFDFRGSEDVIDLSGFEAQITWAELSARIGTADNGRDAVVDLSPWGGGTITLHNVSPAYLKEGMFDLSDTQSPLEDQDEEGGFYVPGTTTYVGSPGNDGFAGGSCDEFIFGGEGDDTLNGCSGNDRVFGGEGDDKLIGYIGQDRLFGGKGHDTLNGGDGDDWLSGGASTDELTGGAGVDTFVYCAGDGSDTITDFTDREDKIDLSALESISGLEDLSVVQLGSFVTIDLHGHGGRTIALENFDIDDLDETDFVFFHPPEPAQDSL